MHIIIVLYKLNLKGYIVINKKKITVMNKADVSLMDEYYKLILEKEDSPHTIVLDSHIVRWFKNEDIYSRVYALGLGNVFQRFRELGYGKNSETFRDLHRSLGYSLCGYWELFYFKSNNEGVNDYTYSEDSDTLKVLDVMEASYAR